MFKRLLLALLAGTVLLSACAKPPVVELVDARGVVAHAYASGASTLAAEVYQLASDALQSAEQQVQQGEYRQAKLSLELARYYSSKALALTVQRKQQLKLEQEQLAEEQRLQAEQAQAQLLAKQQADRDRKAAEARRSQAPSAVKEVVAQPPKLVDRVEVAAGENLATIAAQSEVYQDAMLWPLIYKANRDQIKDPQQIFPGQKFLIPRDKSPAEIEAARLEAEELDLF